MGNLADFIEQYLRNILLQQAKVELQRRDLAKMFRCAPSQINYVLETRFTLERGFIVESKRGGGGYIRITPAPWVNEAGYLERLEELIPEAVSEQKVAEILTGLVEKDLLGAGEAQLCLELMARYFSDLPLETAANLRSKFFRAVLLILGLRDKN